MVNNVSDLLLDGNAAARLLQESSFRTSRWQKSGARHATACSGVGSLTVYAGSHGSGSEVCRL